MENHGSGAQVLPSSRVHQERKLKRDRPGPWEYASNTALCEVSRSTFYGLWRELFTWPSWRLLKEITTYSECRREVLSFHSLSSFSQSIHNQLTFLSYKYHTLSSLPLPQDTLLRYLTILSLNPSSLKHSTPSF